MVAAGLITGNQGKKIRKSDVTAEYIDKFWELVDRF
jgi:CPA1 family monovalent cation:H+ antiporter